MSREDPNFVPPNSANASTVIHNGKRGREEDAAEQRQAKREKSDEDSDEEMEIEDEDDAPSKETCALYSPYAPALSNVVLLQLLPQLLFLSKSTNLRQDFYVQISLKK